MLVGRMNIVPTGNASGASGYGAGVLPASRHEPEDRAPSEPMTVAHRRTAADRRSGVSAPDHRRNASGEPRSCSRHGLVRGDQASITFVLLSTIRSYLYARE